MREPTCLLAYEMNGQPLNEVHGAPLRLRNEREIGFKQVKWIEAIEFVDSFAHLGFGQGGYNEDHEFYGYRMPIYSSRRARCCHRHAGAGRDGTVAVTSLPFAVRES